MKLVEGKYALVTGGGTGIGFGIAQRLLEHGAAHVLIVGRREAVLAAAKDRLLQRVPDAPVAFQTCDVTDEEQVAAAVAAACDADGHLDICVSNAGSGFPAPILEATVEAWRFCCDLNIIGTALCIKHAGRAMRANGGSIITISSAAGSKVAKWMAPYSTTKAAVQMLSQCAAVELAPFKIRVNCVQPGYVPTEVLAENFDDAFKQACLDSTPLGRAGEPVEQGDAVLYLASDMSQWVTGQVLGVCGGMTVPVGEDFESLNRRIYGDELMDACLGK